MHRPRRRSAPQALPRLRLSRLLPLFAPCMIGCPETEREKREKEKSRTEQISIGNLEKIENGELGGAYILNILGLRTFAFSFASASFAISFASICVMNVLRGQ